MHQLLLLRHAKSSHKDKSLADFDRPLAKRGRRDCKRMGKWLNREGIKPDVVISSPSKRTRQTVKQVFKKIGMSPLKVQWEDNVYEASAKTLLKVLAGLPEEAETAMLVGHHEGLESLILRAIQWSEIPAVSKLIPTGAIAWLEIDGEWSSINQSTVRLKLIARPREVSGKQRTDFD
jgi:phosphohistidine phosphatase